MSKGMIQAAILLVACLLLAADAGAQIYKVVDEEGNVTYTDQRPSADAQPMDLPELSVIETDVEVPETPQPGAAAAEGEEKPPTPRELRRRYSDFRILQPQQEETFWGTGNTVVVAWGSSREMLPDITARLYVDGQPQDVSPNGSLSLTLDRGEHNVYAELLDSRKRRIVNTDTVTFFVKQYSQNFNRPRPNPGN